MWISILTGLGATNFLLLVIYLTGSLGIMCTWVPGRTIVVAISLLSLDNTQEISNSMLNNIASHIIPVLFLVVFRIGIHNYKGRQPRFLRHTIWTVIWAVATVVMIVALTSLWFVKSPIIFGTIGVLAIVLNVANIQDMPEHIKTTPIQITWLYVVVADISTTVNIYTISQLVSNDNQLIASIVSNIPFFSILLLAQSTLTSVGTDITSQHIYMLAYQIWPSMAFMLTCFIAQKLDTLYCICIAAGTTIVVIAIQFTVIMKKLA